MAKKDAINKATDKVHKLERRLVAKQNEHEAVEREIKVLYKRRIEEGLDDAYQEEIALLERKHSSLYGEVAALTDMIQEARAEVSEAAQSEIDNIPDKIADLQKTLVSKREDIMREIIEALERVTLLHRRLTGRCFHIPHIGNLELPSLPGEAVREANVRLATLFKDQLSESDPYTIEMKITELKRVRDRGPQALAAEAIAGAAG